MNQESNSTRTGLFTTPAIARMSTSAILSLLRLPVWGTRREIMGSAMATPLLPSTLTPRVTRHWAQTNSGQLVLRLWSCRHAQPGAVFEPRRFNVSSSTRLSVSKGNAAATSASRARARRTVRRLPRSSNLKYVVQWERRSMAAMTRVTQPSGESMQPHSSSMKVARERSGTATSRKLIHSERRKRARSEKDMGNRYEDRNDPHWSPRCLRQNRASSAATSRFSVHVKLYFELRTIIQCLSWVLNV